MDIHTYTPTIVRALKGINTCHELGTLSASVPFLSHPAHGTRRTFERRGFKLQSEIATRIPDI